jgi:YVTN family beta-propeller protein
VTIVDGATNHVLATVPVGTCPMELEYDPQGNKVYCMNMGGDNVTVIDGATNQVLNSLPVGDYPQAICRSPRTGRVFVANEWGSSISVIRDSMSGAVGEAGLAQRSTRKPEPTIVRGVLFLAAKGEGRKANSELLDISGRKVLDLCPGPNDVRSLAPGVYFVRAVGREPSAVSCYKVVLTE